MQSINLNLVPGSFQQVFNCSQGDIGRQLTAKLFDGSTAYEIPAGSTVKIKATKPSGFGFDESATFSGSTVTITTAETMTNEWGRFPAELVITKDGNVIGTANFLFNIEKNPHPDSTVDGDAEEVIPELTLLVERVEAAASSVLDMEVVATTLPAGSQASYSYDEDLNKATFGIPQGEAGAGAAGVVASAYSSSKTYKVGDYVLHNSNLYRCITAITTAEAFTAAHWTQIVLADDVSDLKSDLPKQNFQSMDKVNAFWKRGVQAADGTSANYDAVISEIIEDAEFVILPKTVYGRIFLYKYGNYLGKISANGTMNKTAGDWGDLYGYVDIKSYMTANNANGVKIEIIPVTATTISADDAQTYGDEHSVIYRKHNSNVMGEKATTWSRGSIWADGVFHKTNPWYPDIYYNIAVSDYMENVELVKLNGAVSCGLFFYNNGTFVGKVSANGTINKVGGDWGLFSNIIDVLAIKEKNNIVANTIRFSVEPKDGTSITDENVQDFGEEYATIYTSPFASKEMVQNATINNPNFITYAHKGLSAIAPENTLPAIAYAKKAGFGYVEVDIHWTSDDVPVLLHNDTINSTARNADGTALSSTVAIDSITFEQAQTYDFGIWKGDQFKGTKIPSLEQALTLCKKLGLKVGLDIKTLTSPQFDIIADIIKHTGMTNSFSAGSTTLATINLFHQEFPNALLTYGLYGGSYTDEALAEKITDALTVKGNNDVGLSVMLNALTDAQIETVTESDLLVLCWKNGVEYTEEEVLALNSGIFAIFCDGLNATQIIMENALAQY